MPEFLITAPDGHQYHVTGPEGSTEQQALQQVQQAVGHRPQSMDVVDGKLVPSASPEAQAAQSPVAGNSFAQNALEGSGEYFTQLGQGVHELYARLADTVAPRQQTASDLVTGQDNSRVGAVRQDIAESRRLNAPLDATAGAKVGKLATGVLTTVPALAVPGANTVGGAAVVGAIQGALQPSVTTKEGLLNTGIGAAAGAAGQYLGNKVAQFATNKLASRAASATAQETQNAERDAVLQAGRKAGLVVPPTEVNPSATATALESVSGKAATRQGAQAANQPVVNGLVRQDLSEGLQQVGAQPLGENAPLNIDVLKGVRKAAGAIYAKVSGAGQIASDQTYKDALDAARSVSPDLEQAYPGIADQATASIEKLVNAADVATHDAGSAVQLSKTLRAQAAGNFKAAFSGGGDPEKLALAQAQTKVANAVEDLIGRNLQGSLADQWQSARTLIAKSYQAQSALKANNVSAIKLAAQLEKDKPISGGMELAARFASHFPDAMKLPKGGVGVSKLAAVVGGSGVVGGVLTGNVPLAAASLAGAVTPYAVRKGLLSGAGQAMLATPSYAPGLLGTATLKTLQQAPRVALPLSVQLAQAGQ